MIHYLLYDARGAVFQRGHCATEDEIPLVPGMRAEVIEPEDERTPPAPPPPGYAEHRAMAYPGIGDQLDALWRIIRSNSNLVIDPDARAVMDRVMNVKIRHPKKGQ